MFFRVMSGTHVSGGKVYKAGDLVKSDKDLTATFRGKFKRVFQEELDEEKATKVIKGREAKKAAKDKPQIPTPDSEEGDAKEESKASPDSAEPQEAAQESIKVENIAELDEEDDAEPTESKHGLDVSSEFPDAKKKAITVYVKNHWYVLVDPDDDEIISKKKLRKDDVAPALAEYEDAKTADESEG